MKRFQNKMSLINAKAWDNINNQGVENDFESEQAFVLSLIESKSKIDMNLKYGINHKCFVIHDFGYAIIYNELTQDVFKNQPENVDWCGVDYDGLTHFGKAENPRYTFASERWRGFNEIGNPIVTDFTPLTSIHKK